MTRHRPPATSISSSPPAPRRSAGTFAKGVGSLLLILGFVAGVPYLLARIGAVPTSIPDPGALWRALIGPDLSGRAVFTVLAALVWLGWAWFTLSILRETAAAIASRGRQPRRTSRRASRRTPRGTGWGVQPGAVLVAAVVAMFVTAPLLAAGAPPAAAAGHTGIDTGRPGTVATAAHHPSHAAPGTSSVSRPSHPTGATATSKTNATASMKSSKSAGGVTYTVRRYDTLWSIAQHQLGDPTRYGEIVALNPHLKRDTTIHAGDVLTLPQHSHHTAAPTTSHSKPAVPAPAGPVEQVTVEPGDTLSEISAEHGVDDWRTVWEANKGKAEPGGKHFTNPDHIEVGWDITVPTAKPAAASAAAPATPPALTDTVTAVGPSPTSAPGAAGSPTPAPGAQPPISAPSSTASSTPVPSTRVSSAGADHRYGPQEEDPAGPAAAGQTPSATAPVRQPAPPSSPSQDGQGSGATRAEQAEEPNLATVAGYVAGGGVLAAGIFAALVLVRRQQFRDRRPGRTVASTPETLIPLERAIVSTGAPSADETARIDQVLRRVAATDVPVLHVAAVQLTAGHITVHLSEPAALPAPWHQAGDQASDHTADQAGDHADGHTDDLANAGPGEPAGEGVAWTFPAGLDPQEAGADPSVVDAIAPFPTLVHIGSDATSAWLLNLEQTGSLVLTGDRDRCLSLARVMSAQLGVNAWADIVAVTMLGFGQELVETAPSRLRYAPTDSAGQVLAGATASANQTADFAGELGLAVVEARRSAAGDEAWPVHVMLATTAAMDVNEPAGTAGVASRLAELLKVVHDRSGATGSAVVVVDEQRIAEDPAAFSGATVAHLDAGGTLTMPQVGLTVQAIGWDDATSRGVGMLMAHLRNASDEPVPDATGERPWQHMSDAAGALRPELVQPRATPAVHDSRRRAGATMLPLSDEVYVEVAATTTEDLQVLAPTVSAEVVERVMAADPSLDEDLAAWFDNDSPRAKLAVLGPLTLCTQQPPPKRPAFYTEIAAYLAFRDHGATAEEFMAAFSLSQATSRTYLSNLRDLLGKDPVTGQHYMPSAKTNPAAKARGVGVYLIDGMLVDADLFRRLRIRGQARGTAGMEDYATALRLVTGPPFSQLRDDGGTWLLEGDRIDHYLSLAVVDVAHLLATSALAAGDTATARAAIDIARLAAPDEEAPRLDAAAVDVADGRTAQARQTLREQVCNRSDDGEPPMDLNPRTRQILARHRDWLSRAS